MGGSNAPEGVGIDMAEWNCNKCGKLLDTLNRIKPCGTASKPRGKTAGGIKLRIQQLLRDQKFARTLPPPKGMTTQEIEQSYIDALQVAREAQRAQASNAGRTT